MSEPADAPPLPTQIPPHVREATPSAPPGSVRTTLNLPQGWSLISFPLSRLTAVRGLSRTLYRWSGGQFVVVDPVADPASVDTRQGYVAYVDAPTAVTLEGECDPSVVRSLSLPQGWSLVGCPSTLPFAWRDATVTVGGRTQGLVAASTQTGWFGSVIHASGGPQDVNAAKAALQPAQGAWVWARLPLRLHLHPSDAATGESAAAPEGDGPIIRRLVPSAVAAGDSIQVEGSGFGADGDVAINGRPLTADDILDWSPTRIQLRVPRDTVSGPLTVTVNHVPSNASALTLHDDGSGPATLLGQIQDDQGRPLRGAQIMLDSGQSATTGVDGTWLLDGVPGGQRLAYVTCVGYRLGVASLRVANGGSQSVCIRLTLAGDGPSPSSDVAAPSGETNGWTPPPSGWAHWTPPPGGAPSWSMPPGSPITSQTSMTAPEPFASTPSTPSSKAPAMVVVGDDYSSRKHRWWVSRLEAGPVGQPPLWTQVWTRDARGGSVRLACTGATVGAAYTLRATWTRDDGATTITREWTRTLDAADQTFELDAPY